MILALCADLFFSARIRETAKQLGLPCETVRDPAAALTRIEAGRPALLIVDMNLKTGDAPATVRTLRARHPDLAIVGFLFDSHEDLMLAAEEAGCNEVLSRGQLTRRLPDLLSAAKVPSAP